MGNAMYLNLPHRLTVDIGERSSATEGLALSQAEAQTCAGTEASFTILYVWLYSLQSTV